MWGLILLLAAVVILVVWFLLRAIIQEAQTIQSGARSIWYGGKRVANNTVHVPDLIRTNRYVEQILGAAPDLVGDLERIRIHAETCPGCPKCVVGGRI